MLCIFLVEHHRWPSLGASNFSWASEMSQSLVLVILMILVLTVISEELLFAAPVEAASSNLPQGMETVLRSLKHFVLVYLNHFV